jgi:nucleotide-binding universal stress UspA family protein
MELRNILVAVDMSECARMALEFAIDLAEWSGGKLHLLNAYGLSLSESSLLAYTSDQVEREVVNNSRRELSEWAKRFAPADVELHLSAQDARSGILELAADLEADLIVMGTHGRSGIKHMLMGSVAEYVVRTAPCAVLTVGQKSKGREPHSVEA